MSNHVTPSNLAGTNQIAEESALTSYAGPYVTDMLGRGQALAQMPYQAFEGPLTAGPSALQTQTFGGLASLALPAASAAGSFTGASYQPPTAQELVDSGGQIPITTAPTSPVQQYMNPYLEAALQPQLQGIMRDAQIAQNELASQYAKAGAFGGSRQAVADAELARGALDRMATARGRGYERAFDKASDLFRDDRRYGLDALRAQERGGATQRGIEQEGIAADIAQFEEERDFPYEQLQFQQSLLDGLPLETQTYSYFQPSGLSALGAGLGDITDIYDLITERSQVGGLSPTTQTTALKGQYDYYVALGQTPEEALKSAKADLGL